MEIRATESQPQANTDALQIRGRLARCIRTDLRLITDMEEPRCRPWLVKIETKLYSLHDAADPIGTKSVVSLTSQCERREISVGCAKYSTTTTLVPGGLLHWMRKWTCPASGRPDKTQSAVGVPWKVPSNQVELAYTEKEPPDPG